MKVELETKFNIGDAVVDKRTGEFGVIYGIRVDITDKGINNFVVKHKYIILGSDTIYEQLEKNIEKIPEELAINIL